VTPASGGQAVGIDIGGTKIAVATVDGNREIVRQGVIATESERGFPDALRRIRQAVDRALAESGWTADHLGGIGVGCAGPVDPARGTIHNPHTLPGWDGADIVAPLREAFRSPVRLENDADMALLGECDAGAGRGFDPVVMLTFGTGIGGGAMQGGALLRGVGGEHPELGHVSVDPGGPLCYCGAHGCFESLASGSALDAAARSQGWRDASELLNRAGRGEAPAVRLRAEALAATTVATASLLHTLLPERILLGGGMMDEHYDLFAAAATDAVARAAMVPKGRVTVARPRLGSRAALVGAAAAVLAREREA
jgi:glucokinase